MNVLNQMITNELKKKPLLHRAYGVVTSEVNSNGKYTVRIALDYDEVKRIKSEIERGEDIDTSRDISLINKSHDILVVGDYVWIHYWNVITDGYIAIRYGLSSLQPQNDNIPYHRLSHIKHAYIIQGN